MEDEGAVRKVFVRRFVDLALPGPRDQPFHVELIVDCVGTVLAWMKL